MKIEKKIFSSKIARRIFVLFVFCSLLPITLLAAVSFHQVTSSLEDQYLKRMQQTVKSVSVTVYERLLLFETNMKMIVLDYNFRDSTLTFQNSGQESLYDQWFKGIIHISLTGEKKAIYKDIEDFPEIQSNNDVKNANGKTVLISQPTSNNARIFMVKHLDGNNIDKGFIAVELNIAFLWGIGHFNTIPQQTRLCVIDQFRNIYVNPFESPSDLLQGLTKDEISGKPGRSYYFKHDGTEYLASYQSLFMQSNFVSPNWIFILSQKKDDVLESLTYFKKVFPLVILLSIWIVLLLSIYYIRKNLIPLEKLKAGTERVAHRDFSTSVEVETDDEFADLAASFNSMSVQLNKQFNTLSTRAEIDRKILSSLDTNSIVETMLTRLYAFLDCQVIGIGLVNNSGGKELSYYLKDSEGSLKKEEEQAPIKPERLETLLSEEYVLIEKGEALPSYIPQLENDPADEFVVIPAVVNGKLVAVIIVGYRGEMPENQKDECVLLSQLANQMAVALENSRLIDDLAKFSWGAIEAFGRAVDAKSSWTAGHSERVTSYAMQIARAMPLSEERLETLHRAAFIHDIGKIGIAMTILDKPASLSEEEYALMKRHPSMGALILEPIEIFEEVIPIIIQHHENYDGSGYPKGLKGDEILIEARILSVADVFDALVSVRPYRKEWDRERIINHLREQSGKKFDGEIVEVFLKLLTEDAITVNPLLLFDTYAKN